MSTYPPLSYTERDDIPTWEATLWSSVRTHNTSLVIQCANSKEHVSESWLRVVKKVNISKVVNCSCFPESKVKRWLRSESERIKNRKVRTIQQAPRLLCLVSGKDFVWTFASGLVEQSVISLPVKVTVIKKTRKLRKDDNIYIQTPKEWRFQIVFSISLYKIYKDRYEETTSIVWKRPYKEESKLQSLDKDKSVRLDVFVR